MSRLLISLWNLQCVVTARRETNILSGGRTVWHGVFYSTYYIYLLSFQLLLAST